MHTQTTDATIIDAYKRAFDRAVKARVVCYRVDDATYEVPSISDPARLHIVRRSGRAWHAWTCDCKAGARPACVHRAVAVYAHKYHTGAVRPNAARKEVVSSTRAA